MFLQLTGVFQRASIALFCLPCTGEEEIICLWAVQYMHQFFFVTYTKCCVQNLIYLRWHILLSVFANFDLFWPFPNTRLVVETTMTAEILETDKVLALVFKRCVQRWCCSSNVPLVCKERKEEHWARRERGRKQMQMFSTAGPGILVGTVISAPPAGM